MEREKVRLNGSDAVLLLLLLQYKFVRQPAQQAYEECHQIQGPYSSLDKDFTLSMSQPISSLTNPIVQPRANFQNL